MSVNRTYLKLRVPSHADIEWRIFNKKGIRLPFVGIIEVEAWSQIELHWGLNRKELKLQGFYALPCVVYIAGAVDREVLVADQIYEGKNEQAKKAEIASINLPKPRGRKRAY